MELCAHYICTWPLHTSLWNKKITYKSRVRLESTIGMTESAKGYLTYLREEKVTATEPVLSPPLM